MLKVLNYYSFTCKYWNKFTNSKEFKDIPKRATIEAKTLPKTVIGAKSPYPTVYMVTNTNQTQFCMLSKPLLGTGLMEETFPSATLNPYPKTIMMKKVVMMMESMGYYFLRHLSTYNKLNSTCLSLHTRLALVFANLVNPTNALSMI